MPNPSVTVAPTAVVSMMLHAAKHVHDPVHGVLMGSYGSDNKLSVDQAIPVCHGAPTHPLVETALALIESVHEDATLVVVGWYVSPRLLKDDRPGPAALKIVSSLGSSNGSNNKEPALLVVRNDELDKLIAEGSEAALDSVVKAFGKDFGKQWLEPLSLSFSNKSGTAKSVQSAFAEKIPVMDLVDHFAGDPRTSKWPNNDSLTRFVKQQSS